MASGNQFLEEIKRGQKPSDELKDYLKKLSAGRRSSSPTQSTSPLRVGPGLLRRRSKKLRQVRLGGRGILEPCFAENSMAIAAPSLKGYTLGSDFQVGNPVELYDFPGGVQIELHTHSSLVNPKTGEFSLCAAVNNKTDAENWYPPHILYPPEIQFGNIQATQAKGTIWQILNTPTIFQKNPKTVTATAVLSADHVMISLLARTDLTVGGTFAGIYGQADITLYGGFDFLGVAPPSASQILDFLAVECSPGSFPSSSFSDLDGGQQVSNSVNLPWDGNTEWFIVEVNLIITCLIYKQDKDGGGECASADLRLVDDNRTMVIPDLDSMEETDSSMSCPIVLDSITLCG
ncbi:MAG: hypothetical protein ABR912_17185 [Terracidiphilus sp.]|jgi:hypothetical protein